MASVMAIVSKALFEKMVPKDVALGTVVTTDRYVSTNKVFDALGKGDAIFLVTVRPPNEALWLVGILESPKRKEDAYVAANAAPLADITSVIPALELASGTGLKAKKGALGMSLQTPRALTAGDVAKIRALVPKAGKAKVSAREAYNAAVEDVVHGEKKKSKKSKAAKGPAAWRFENYRKPFAGTLAKLAAAEKKQIAQLVKEEGGGKLEDLFASAGENEEWDHLEVVDVVEVASKKVKYQLYLWPYGSGALFKAGTLDIVANVCQHGLDGEDESLNVAHLAAAYAEGKKRLKIQEIIDFSDDDDE